MSVEAMWRKVVKVIYLAQGSIWMITRNCGG